MIRIKTKKCNITTIQVYTPWTASEEGAIQELNITRDIWKGWETIDDVIITGVSMKIGV